MQITDFDNAPNLVSLFLSRADELGDKPFLTARLDGRWQSISYAEAARRGVRPTLLQPFWRHAGFALGAVTAAMGPKAAMACTAAVETEIDRHYSRQLAELGDHDIDLLTGVQRRVILDIG